MDRAQGEEPSFADRLDSFLRWAMPVETLKKDLVYYQDPESKAVYRKIGPRSRENLQTVICISKFGRKSCPGRAKMKLIHSQDTQQHCWAIVKCHQAHALDSCPSKTADKLADLRKRLQAKRKRLNAQSKKYGGNNSRNGPRGASSSSASSSSSNASTSSFNASTPSSSDSSSRFDDGFDSDVEIYDPARQPGAPAAVDAMNELGPAETAGAPNPNPGDSDDGELQGLPRCENWTRGDIEKVINAMAKKGWPELGESVAELEVRGHECDGTDLIVLAFRGPRAKRPMFFKYVADLQDRYDAAHGIPAN